MGSHTELLFIDGNSTDGTVEKIQEQIAAHPELDIKFVPQVPPLSPDADTPPDLMLKLGKGDAVRKAFDAASCDVLMILDSDLTVPPEELPKFYRALVTGKGRMINGTRFVYEQEAGAMPPLNKLGNVFFSKLFSWLMSQPVTDTLCGTKVLFKQDYEAIKANRSYFGDFDPFGDFDLLFGAARLNHRILEVPVHYRARSYGDSKVRVGMHGPLLARMSWVGLWKFKLLPLITFRRRPKGEPSRTPDAPTPEAAAAIPTRPILIAVVVSAIIALWQSLKRERD
jgi:glycosyltransferase involved in cell wall biosynthesis